MEGNRPSEIPCPKCGHPTTEIVGITAIYPAGSLSRPAESVIYEHRCTADDCEHKFERKNNPVEP